MISVVLYGRNDNHGYNLHKRGALSINCIAELLTNVNDEILFVDYNTPDDYPTFPEAIQDTLTSDAKLKLRILRVRPRIHARYMYRTSLLALEPISRNIAVRRSNPKNRWILSTNTDMIFVPNQGASLSDVAASLADGYYHLPRFELPESLWETLDRSDPKSIINKVRYWGRRLHLDEIVHLEAPDIRFDAPGDFQLILREDLFSMRGFDEDMLLGWHVDSNMARRLFMVHKSIGDISNHFRGYHCDHTRQVTPSHRRNSPENSIAVFVENLIKPDKEDQAEYWGCAADHIEEIKLARSAGQRYLSGLELAIKQGLQTPTISEYSSVSYDKVSYSTSHVLPYLCDIFTGYSSKTIVGWVGLNLNMLVQFRQCFEAIHSDGRIYLLNAFHDLIINELDPDRFGDTLKFVDVEIMLEHAQIVVFDFYYDDSLFCNEKTAYRAAQDKVLKKFYQLVSIEKKRLLHNLEPRRFVCINVINNRFESIVNEHIFVSRTPFNTRIRQGFVVHYAKELIDYTSKLVVASAGFLVDGKISAKFGFSGNISHTSLPWLRREGKYTFNLMIKLKISPILKNILKLVPNYFLRGFSVVIVIMLGEEIISYNEILRDDMLQEKFSLSFQLLDKTVLQDGFFDVSNEYKLIIWSGGLYSFLLEKAELEFDPSC